MSIGLILAGWVQRLERSVQQSMLEAVSDGNLLSFSLGLPDADLFLREECARASEGVLSQRIGLQYGKPNPALKTQIVGLMKARGVVCCEDNIFLTSGAQQALHLLTQVLLEHSGTACCDQLTYNGFLLQVRALCPNLITIPVRWESGADFEELRARFKSQPRPAFIYTMPTGHNPLGRSLGAEQRFELIEIARRYRVPIIEDDAYGFLQYGDKLHAPLRALDSEIVLYVGTFSKIIGPALRVGWIVASRSLVEKLAILKEGLDINTGTFAQHVVSRCLDRVDFGHLIDSLRHAYCKRRNVMLGALARHLPEETRWMQPDSGFFVWVQMPGTDTRVLLRAALIEEKIAFMPGDVFSADAATSAIDCLRLSYSNAPIDQISDGIARLAQVMRGGLCSNCV